MANEIKHSEIIIYQAQDGNIKVDCCFDGDTFWLTQAQMMKLFQSSKANISEHISHIFKEGELNENSVVRKYRTTGTDGKNYNIKHYNLDVILAVGYRIKSTLGIQFRQWATAILHEYLQKGYSMNDDFLKNMGGGIYWKELLERIRDIRASEKVMYRQILDLYATSLDYNASMPETYEFFKTVQNKLHYAVSGNTASEIIFNRANVEKVYLTVLKDMQKKLIKVNKNDTI